MYSVGAPIQRIRRGSEPGFGGVGARQPLDASLNWNVTYLGGYLQHDVFLKSPDQQAQDALYVSVAKPLAVAN